MVDYVMRFEKFSSVEERDGLLIGGTTNLRFALDLQITEQIYNPPDSNKFNGVSGVVTSKIITSFDLGGYCQKGGDQFGPVDLPPGDPAWVESLDLTMTTTAPIKTDDSAPEKPKFNAMCYGYRINNIWYWEPEPQHATWDPITSRYRLKFIIQKGPIDAIKVLSGNGQAIRQLDRMVLTIKPQ